MNKAKYSKRENAMDRRRFLKTGAFATGALALGGAARPAHAIHGLSKSGQVIEPKADAMILIWLPGGVAQADTWDPKEHTPFQSGMKGSDLYSTCASIPTSADGIFLGEGLETIARVMHKGTILRTLTSDTKFGAIHLRAQHYLMTSYEFPAGLSVPSIGAMVGRTLGRKDANVPAYIDIGRDISTADEEMLFISNYQGPGFLGIQHAPFMIPEPAKGLPTLSTLAAMTRDQVDRRHAYLRAVAGMAAPEILESEKAKDYMQVMEDAHAMMDSPVRNAFNLREESPETLASYDVGHRFGTGCLLARRLVEVGARFVEVEYQYAPFKGFDTHEDASTRIVDMKKQIDRPIGNLIRELDERGLLERTLVVIASEFGRTIAEKPKAGTEAFGFDESQTGESLTVESPKMYGHHGHFSSASSMLFFGGGFKEGSVYGKTAPRHPMMPVENPVHITDVYATIYKALGIPADTYHITENRPFYVTKDGDGQAIDGLLA